MGCNKQTFDLQVTVAMENNILEIRTVSISLDLLLFKNVNSYCKRIALNIFKIVLNNGNII